MTRALNALVPLTLPALVVLAYLPALRCGFVGEWDDNPYVVRNPHLPAADGLARIWLTTEAPQYYPLTFTTYWLEWRLWRDWAPGYHATSLLLHAVAALLVYFLAVQLGAAPAVAWLAAAIFGLHPLQVGSVAWIAERKTVLAGLFSFLAILLYVRHRRTGREALYVAAGACFAAAMLSKTVAVTVLPTLLLADGIILRQRGWSGPVRIAILLVPAIPILLLTAAKEQAWTGAHLPVELRPLAAGAALWFYVGRFAVPRTLLPVYPAWNVAASATWFAGLIAAVAAAAAVWLGRRRLGDLATWGLAQFAVTLLPALGLVHFGFLQHAPVADHLVYFALLGLALAAAVGLAAAARRLRLRTAAGMILAAGLVTALGVKTWFQTRIWRDPLTLWTYTLAHNPDFASGHNNLAVALHERGDLAGAQRAYERVIALRPTHAEAHNNLGVLFADAGRWAEAIAHYRAAIAANEGYAKAWYNLGRAYRGAGQRGAAIDALSRALELARRTGPAVAVQTIESELAQVRSEWRP